MKQLYVQLTYINDTNRYINHVDDIQESEAKNLSDLYKLVKKRFKGRISKMYRDDSNKKTIHTGYIVTRKQKYKNCNETYIESIWIELLEQVKVQRLVTEYKPISMES